MNDKLSIISTIIVVIAVLGFFVTRCAPNSCSRNFGGTSTITLTAGQKLVNVTWKEAHIWVLTRPMVSNETTETYSFSEKSNLGILQGTVIIKEIR
jgi:hypothetical protein